VKEEDMPCSLQDDASNKHDFTSPSGSNVTVKVISTSPNVSARFAKASHNDAPLPVKNGDTIAFTVDPGENTLDLVVNASDPNCNIRILEDCGGTTQVLDEFPNDPGDPAVGYSILGL